MINVRISRDATGFIRQFSVKGHAGYAARGRDIVCAAASTVAYTAAGALEELAGLGDLHSEKEGYFFLKLPQDLTPEQEQKAGIIMETMYIGFKQIELSYKEFIQVMEEEV